MLSTLILYLTQKFETFTYLQKVYGLGVFRDVGDVKFIAFYEGNTEQHLNLDTHESCCIFLTNGKKTVEQLESEVVANEYHVRHTYPFKCLVYSKSTENINCASASRLIADSIEKSITGRQKQLLISTQLVNAYIDVKETTLEKHELYANYFSGGGLGDNDILIEIEFDFIVEGNQNCFVDSPCNNDDFVFDFESPETFCERVDECLDIPTEDGQYVLDITDGVKSWAEYSPSGAVVISKTQAQFLALVAASDLDFPAVYKITDIQNGLYIDTLSANTFSNDASLSFLAPDYTLNQQYHSSDGAVANGSTVTWGGYYWTNNTGGSVTPDLPDEFDIDSDLTGWTKVTKSVANGYVEIMLSVEIINSGSISITKVSDAICNTYPALNSLDDPNYSYTILSWLTNSFPPNIVNSLNVFLSNNKIVDGALGANSTTKRVEIKRCLLDGGASIGGNTLVGIEDQYSNMVNCVLSGASTAIYVNNLTDSELIDVSLVGSNIRFEHNILYRCSISNLSYSTSNSKFAMNSFSFKEPTTLDLTGWTRDIVGVTIQGGSGWFTITHNFTTSPLNSGDSVLYNLIPNGASITNITASGSLTGTTIEIGLETDAEGLINEAVGLLPLEWSGVSSAATANRSLKIKATGGDITAGTLTVKVEFTI